MTAAPLGSQRIGARVVGGVLAVIISVAAVSIYAFYRVDRVQESVGVGNQFYVPVLKHLNMVSGKWAAYLRTFESNVSFRKWGTAANGGESETGVELPASQSIHLKQMIEANLAELALRSEQRSVPEALELKVLVDQLSSLAEREPGTLAAIEAALKTKNYTEAASLYTRARQEHLSITRDLAQLSRDVEGRLALLQLSEEQELRSALAVMVLLIGGCLLSSVVVLFRLRRWLKPIVEWTRVAQEIALKGIHRDVRFPAVRREMPPEIALLTREFTRMGMTVLERERTIHQQKQKVESLNNNLKEQNLMLRRLGGLNERILDSMSSGLLVIGGQGGDGVVEQFNERYCELFGVERSGVLGKTARETLAAWPAELVSRWLAADEGTDAKAVLTATRVPLGARVFDIRVQPLHEGSGRLLMFEDVSGLVAAEAKLEHARRLVLAGHLSSQVAHEVRNPLNSMSLQLEMLEEDLEQENLANPTTLARVATVAEQVDRLDRITRRYLDVGRPRAGAKREPVELATLIESCLRFLSAEIQACGAEVKLDLAPGCVIAGDADGVSQVIFNLVRNALEAMRDHAGQKILAVKTLSEGGFVRCVVSDSGPGVDEAVRSRLFEPFVTNKASGHGLGLSVSRQICIDHGGELRNLHGESGAAFEFSLAPYREVPPC